jgi:ATP-binding cassette subfamily B protein
MRKLKILDYFRFQRRSENQESIYEIINGVSEMKLNQFEDFKRKKWEEIQQKLFKINIRILKLEQIQLSGFEFLNQLKNIVVTFIAASFVIKGNMTLGALLSVSYIIGQMNSPVNQLISFFRSLQDAKLSLSRLNEVQNHPEEEQENLLKLNFNEFDKNKNAEFLQTQSDTENSTQTEERTKLPSFGGVGGGLRIQDISPQNLRENCGTVMQDGFIFSDTIERNIATGDENIDGEKLQKAIKIANIKDFIGELPLGLNTKIGASGNGISGGQKQRILIARAVYKNPHYIFFDEATSALDAENEKIIHDNLQEFFKGKTVLIIAHRLSTVKNADQIIVLKNGKLAEQGSHYELVNKKAEYFNLVKNQLELGG